MLSRGWLPKGTPADATQRNATRQDRTQRNATRQDRTEQRRTPTGSTPARPDNLKEVEPCLAAGGSRREHLRTQRDTTRRNVTQRDTTRRNATQRDATGRDATRRKNAHPEHIHTTRMGAHPLPTHNHPFFITKNSSYAIQIPFRQEKTANDRRSQII